MEATSSFFDVTIVHIKPHDFVGGEKLYGTCSGQAKRFLTMEKDAAIVRRTMLPPQNRALVTIAARTGASISNITGKPKGLELGQLR
jgi:hypothetical protein